MSDQNADVLDFLRASFARVDEQLDKVCRVQQEHTERLGRLESVMVSVRRDNAEGYAQSVALLLRLDGVNEWFDRIERRLGLMEPAL